MKYRAMRTRAYDYLFERLGEAKRAEELCQEGFKRILLGSGDAFRAERAQADHREAVSLVKKLTASVEALRAASHHDDKEVEDFVRPLWRPFHWGRSWFMPVVSMDKWFLLRVGTRDLFREDKRVFKIFNQTKFRKLLCNKSGDSSLFQGLSPAKHAIQKFPEAANGLLWDAITKPSDCLEKVTLAEIYEELVEFDPERSHIWIDGPGGTRYIYGIGRKVDHGTTTSIHICAGNSKRKQVLRYILPSEDSAVYYRFRRPRDIQDECVILFRRYANENSHLMWWGGKETPQGMKKSLDRFKRVALFHLHDLDEHTLHPDVDTWEQEDERGCPYRIVRE